MHIITERFILCEQSILGQMSAWKKKIFLRVTQVSCFNYLLLCTFHAH